MGFFDFIGDIFQPNQKTATTTGYSTPVANPNYQGYTAALLNPRSEISDRADEITRSLAMNGSPSLQGANAYNTKVLQGGFLNQNPYLDKTFDMASKRVGDAYRTGTAPQIAAQASLAGRYGSGAQRNTERDARNQFGDTLNNLATQIYGGAYNTERGAMESAASRAPNLVAADYYGANQLAKQGSVRDAYFDQAATRQYQQWRDNQTLPYMYGAGTQTQQSQPFYGNSPFETALGVGSLIAPFFLGSDRRLKKDIKRVGKLKNGLPLYAFKYKWGGPEQIGVMADEVEKVLPGAVMEIGGYKHVNYAMLGG